MTKSYQFAQAPGYLIRRAQQIAVSVFMEATQDYDVTPVQFAILNALIDDPGEDQITLSKNVAFDPATFGSVISRLEGKGWVMRALDAADRRRKLLWITDSGRQAAVSMKRAVAKAQTKILEPLDDQEQAQLLKLLARLVSGHDNAAGDDAKTP